MMKPGRNDPCPCGSGKKFKRCCMSHEGKLHADVQDEVAALLAMNPHLSLDELNLALQHKMADRNNQPHPDFCGVTPTQMANWLYALFDQLQWLTISTPDNLAASPVMRYLGLILDEAMAQEGSFKATSKGNLPTTIVKQASALLPEFAVAQGGSRFVMYEFTGNNEDKFNALHYTRVLAEISGIIYRRSGRYHVKKTAQKQYLDAGIQAFFKPMLAAAVSQYNWAYLDHYSPDVDVRTFWVFMLWRLQCHHSAAELVQEVITAFPDVLLTTPADPYLSPENYVGALIELRFIERFLQYWGFVTVEPRRYSNAGPVDRKVAIQPLFDHTFQFTLNR